MTVRAQALGTARVSRAGFALASKRTSQTMRTAVVSAPKQIDLLQGTLPKPKPNELLVRIEGCGVCASNIPPWEGKPWFTYPMAPGALGHEAWGTVEDVGSAVRGFTQGDRVAILSNNAYADYDVCDSSSAVPLPAGLDQPAIPSQPLGCAMTIFQSGNICKEH